MQQNKDRFSNSTSSLYLRSTISNPNVKSLIQAISNILYTQMLKDKESGKTIKKESELYFFSEEKYIEEKPEEFDEERIQLLREMPSVDNIYEFMKALYDCAQFSAECCVIGLIYIQRLITFTNLSLCSTNWRPLILSSLLIAQKVWDDRCLTNNDFIQIYPFFTSEEINKLEAKFLEYLEYNVTVKGSSYASYYFQLRDQFKLEQEFPLTPLDVEQSAILEARSVDVQKKEQERAQKLSLTYNEKQAKKPNAMIN